MRLFRVYVVLVILLAACGIDKADEYLCTAEQPACPEGMVCNGTKCVEGQVDAAPLDVQKPDAGDDLEIDTVVPPKDVAVDVPVDVAKDTAVDSGSDAAIDVEVDVLPDAPADVAPDVAVDVAVDAPPPLCVEGSSCYTGPVETLGPNRPCATGTWTGCSTATPVCSGEVLPEDSELCNGVDDDCDGTIDDFQVGCYTGPAGTENIGICHGGTRSCLLGAWTGCTGEVHPADEICNGDDDDCNGDVDDGLTQYTRYKDADGDGWGAGSSTTCYSSRSGYVTKSGDCHDNNDEVHPGVTQYTADFYIDTKGSKSWDWNCDKNTEKNPSLDKKGACGGSPPNCTTTFGFLNGVPDCGVQGVWLSSSNLCTAFVNACGNLSSPNTYMTCR